MDRLRRSAAGILACTVCLYWQPLARPALAAPADGQHDFDFNFGTWRTHITRLLHPLTGSATWITLDGTVAVRKVWDGRASIEEVEADGPSGHFENLGLFLYDPQAHQWSQTFANSRTGSLSGAMTGEFRAGRGEFYDQETYNGRSIIARAIWSDITPNSHRFEQAFSGDGGKTWETNFIAKLTRDSAVADSNPTDVAAASQAVQAEHAFDFDFGSWKIHMSRLRHPLTGSTTWTPMDGTTVTRKIWNGKANLAEVEADGPIGHLELLALRLYDPAAHQWSISFATSNVGVLSVPAIGEFRDGRGEFIDQEPLNDRTILVRFRIYPTTANAAHSEQAFSDDGGKTWETNWINDYERNP